MIILESVNLWPARTERLWSEASLISRCHPDFLLPKSMERALTWWRRPWLLVAKRRYVESNAKRCSTRNQLMARQSMIVISFIVTSVIWRMAPWFEMREFRLLSCEIPERNRTSTSSGWLEREVAYHMFYISEFQPRFRLWEFQNNAKANL